MKKSRKIISATLLACMTLSSTTIAFAEAPLTDNTGNQDNGKLSQEIMPRADLSNQTLNFNGDGSATFSFYGGGPLRMSFTNYGSSTLYYKVQYPFGAYLLGSANSGNALSPGETMTYSMLDVEGVHGSDAYGRYTVFAYTADGSAGSLGMHIRSLGN